MTVWLRDFDKFAKVTSSTLIPCKGGMYHVINPVLSELAAAKPVVLFDKPVCVYFSQHNRCARRGCQKTHRSEKQIQTLIAARHVQLKEMSSEEREAHSTELVEKEQDGAELYHMAASQNARTTMGNAAKEFDPSHSCGGYHHHHHHHHHHRRGVPTDLGTEEITEPEPLDLPVEVPEDIKAAFTDDGPKSKVYITCVLKQRMTVWLRDFDKFAKVTSSTLIPCKGGMYHVINPVLSELAAAKPVVLFDKPVCVYFSQHNRCARRGCQKTHRSEKQIQTLIAARHVQLKEMSSEERDALSKELVEKEQDGVELYNKCVSNITAS